MTHSHYRWIALPLALLALAGCSQKPPGCADPEVQTTLRKLLIGEPDGGSSDPVVAGVLQEVKLTLANVVSEGYQADAKKQSCRAQLNVELPEDKGFSREIVYSTQLTVDQKDSFVLSVEDAQVLQLAITGSLPMLVSQRRWGGEWQGEISCTASTRAGLPQPEAFTERFTAQVERGSLRARFAGREGVTLATGGISDEKEEIFLDSDGKEGQPSHTRLMVFGKPQPGLLKGSARYVDMADKVGEIVRECTFRLAKGALPAAGVAPATASAMGWPGVYVGEGEGDVTLEVKPAGADKRHPISMTTSTAKAGGGCGGAVEGFGTASGDELRIVTESDGQRCEAVAKRSGTVIGLEEGAGCNFFHGAACGFSASLTRKP